MKYPAPTDKLAGRQHSGVFILLFYIPSITTASVKWPACILINETGVVPLAGVSWRRLTWILRRSDTNQVVKIMIFMVVVGEGRKWDQSVIELSWRTWLFQHINSKLLNKSFIMRISKG